MKKKSAGALTLLMVFSLIMLGSGGGCAGDGDSTEVDRETLYQVSTLDALAGGLYDGVMSLEALGRYGDFGIGTFAKLDGEMIEAGGKFYQIKADGKAYLQSGATLTPFACVTYFDADREEQLAPGLDYPQLQKYLDGKLPTANIFYAIKIEGTFSYIKTRSVPSQEKPYPPLAEVTRNQSVFEFHDVKGTIIGFRCPPYVTGVNLPGYHLHFLTQDRDAGGHLLELTVQQAAAFIDDTPAFLMSLPGRDSDFYKLDLAQSQADSLNKAEK